MASQSAYGQADSSAEDSIPESMVEQTALMMERLPQVKTRLQLTVDQEEQMLAILKGNVEKARTVMQEHDIAPGASLSFSQKISLARDLKPIKKESEKSIEAILNSDQMKEFKIIRKEIVNEIKALSEIE